MSIEDELKNLTAAITALGKDINARAAASVDEVLKITVPGELTIYPESSTVVNTGEQTIDDPYAGLNAKQIAGKKAAATRKANKEKKALAESAVGGPDSGVVNLGPNESEMPGATEISDTFIDMGIDDDDDDFLNNTVDDADNFLDDAPPKVTVMDQKDPRAALRAHLGNISKALTETGKQETLVKMMKSRFGTTSFLAITEDKFDDFLAYAIALLPAEKQSRIA